jgi:CelD/BcsL family acetyltransferase involved in cellulose biosynthesis
VKVELIEHVERLEELRASWDTLAVARGRPYSAPAWQLAWWHEARPADAFLLAAAVWDREELVAIAPMYVRRSRVSRCGTLGSPAADGVEPLARAGTEAEAASALAGALGEATPRPLVLTLRGRGDDPEWPRLLAHGWPDARPPWLHDEPPIPAPKIDLRGRTADEWLASLSSNTRSQLKRRRRRLLDAGATFRTSAVDELERDIAVFTALHRSRWEWRGGSAVLSNGVESMVLRAARELATENRFRLYAVDLGHRTIAAQIVMAAGGTASHWLGGFEEAWAPLQPGIQTIYYAIEAAFEQGDEVFDLGGGAEEYKGRLATRGGTVVTTSLVPRGSGYLGARIAIVPRHLRQAVAARIPVERRRRLKQRLWWLRRGRRAG